MLNSLSKYVHCNAQVYSVTVKIQLKKDFVSHFSLRLRNPRLSAYHMTLLTPGKYHGTHLG